MISESKILPKIDNLTFPTNAISLIINLSSGFIFDTYGRKKPQAFFYFCVVIGWIMYPLGWGSSDHTLWEGYFISVILL